MAKEFNVLALIKGEDRYVYIYDDGSKETLIEALHNHAARTDLNLNWFDAAILTDKAEQQTEGTTSPPNPWTSRLPF